MVSKQKTAEVRRVAIHRRSSQYTDIRQKANDNIRIRNNQRRSRARRKEYVQDLESKLRHCEQVGHEASAELQAAAQKTMAENVRLRQLLERHGIPYATADGARQGWQGRSAPEVGALVHGETSDTPGFMAEDLVYQSPWLPWPSGQHPQSQDPYLSPESIAVPEDGQTEGPKDSPPDDLNFSLPFTTPSIYGQISQRTHIPAAHSQYGGLVHGDLLLAGMLATSYAPNPVASTVHAVAGVIGAVDQLSAKAQTHSSKMQYPTDRTSMKGRSSSSSEGLYQ